ncbi:MAG: Hsp20/alpha crystallin family protein [Deltaproteobacteria bacterium]|nr:Hsp20/alpha crystallin family protein [Deltaproteobacteria bacterium]MBN2688091.1 Hsp20/alpha crystallin family protein [Deltaproteobacteria bacterium]
MPQLIMWKNRELDKMKRDIERLMSRLRNDFGLPFQRMERRHPHIELSETEDHLIIRAEIPWVDPENLDVSVIDGVLTIKGEAKEEAVGNGGEQVTERVYRRFSRAIQLPCKIDVTDIEATYRDGTLLIVMPKCKPEAVREIKIKIT